MLEDLPGWGREGRIMEAGCQMPRISGSVLISLDLF